MSKHLARMNVSRTIFQNALLGKEREAKLSEKYYLMQIFKMINNNNYKKRIFLGDAGPMMDGYIRCQMTGSRYM